MAVAEEMKNLFGEKIELNTYTTASPEAMKYNFKSSTNVLFEGELIPLDVSLDKGKMKDFLSEKLSK